MKFKSILLISLFFITTNVFAINDCTNSEMKRLKELANNVKINYDYEIDEEIEKRTIAGYFYVQINNLNNDLQIYLKDTSGNLKLYSKSEIEEINFNFNSTEKFYIYSYTDNLCTNKLIKTITIKFPSVNPYYYYNKEKCIEHTDFKYCQEFYQHDLDLDEIDEMYNEYINKNNITDQKTETFNKDYIYIIIASFLIISVVIFIVIKIIKNKKEDI